MGTQKGRVDVQQQPPSLLQTPQLPGAAPARPEVTRLLPTTRLRLALPLSISLLPPSFALYTLSLSLSLPFSLLLSSSLSLSPSSLFLSLAHHHSPTRTPLHCHLHAYTLEGCAYLSLALFLCVCLFLSLSSRELTPRGIASDSQRTEAKRAASLPRCGTAAEERDVATPTSTPATTSLNALVAREQ